jgi:hypothetical protein
MDLLSSKYKIFFSVATILCFLLFPVISIAADSSANKPGAAMLLTGTLADTPPAVTQCEPLNIKFGVRNTGEVPATAGQYVVEIRSAVTGRSVFVQEIPFTMEPEPIVIESVSFPPGAYILTLKSSALNWALQIADEVKLLARQPLTVSAPIQVIKRNGSMLRVLVWLSRTGTAIQQVFTEKILKEAFEADNIYYVTVDSAEDFKDQTMSGGFNVGVLFEPDELLDQSDWLMDRVTRGQGLVIIGSENRTRMIAESFGFKFGEIATSSCSLLELTEDSGMELCGTVPVSGRILLPRKSNAKLAAILAGDKKPAILIDTEGKGRVIIMPFSFTRSALDLGSTSLYSLLLRSAVLKTALETDERTGLSSIELLVSAQSGPVKARVMETLPPGTRILWTTAEGSVKNNTILFDLTADSEPQIVRYLCQPPAGNKTPAFTEVFYECQDKLVSQGKIE